MIGEIAFGFLDFSSIKRSFSRVLTNTNVQDTHIYIYMHTLLFKVSLVFTICNR